ncbi:MAG: CopG family ribbon-helix-helix protein [Verrucomicrobiota bacterium]|jgi:CopG family nickel-responsive transcriptional regulator|nr:CopG family ribbon-helix-helix protein [Verrucomicrobiota bacterium]
MAKNKQTAKRFSITMPAELYGELDRMVEARGLDNRSMAIADIVKRELLDYKQQKPNRVMAGVITLSYDEAADTCAGKLLAIRRGFLKEVISCFQVMLEDGKNLEVWLVQGEVTTLQRILGTALKGSASMLGQLTFADAILPPLPSDRDH